MVLHQVAHTWDIRLLDSMTCTVAAAAAETEGNARVQSTESTE